MTLQKGEQYIYKDTQLLNFVLYIKMITQNIKIA